MSETAVLAIFLAAVAGILAGRAWAAARHRGGPDGRPAFRSSEHYAQGLHYLTTGRLDLAISELSKVAREDRGAIEVLLVLGTLLRETGQVERAIQVHQGLLAKGDLSRGERAHVLVALGTDFRKAGFLDRATSTLEEVLDRDPRNIAALVEMQRLYEEQRRWRDAYGIRTRLARLRKTDDSRVLGHLQAEMGREALQRGDVPSAEEAFRTALSLDRTVLPAHLGLADSVGASDPRKAAAILEDAVRTTPERAYLTFDRLATAYKACGEPSRFVHLCEEVIRQDPRDWRARLALARHVGEEGRGAEAFGLLLRAIETNPQVHILHVEILRLLRAQGVQDPSFLRYLSAAEEAVFYRDPHVCTACRYRADGMLWRCPHCHEWATFVEERVGTG